MTTQDVLKTLEGIMDKIATPQFSQKVKVLQSEIIPENIPSTLSDYSNAGDAFITLASTYVKHPAMLDVLALCADPKVLFVVFTRYQELTQMFKGSEPEKAWKFSTNPADFMTNVLIEEWKSYITSQSVIVEV